MSAKIVEHESISPLGSAVRLMTLPEVGLAQRTECFPDAVRQNLVSENVSGLSEDLRRKRIILSDGLASRAMLFGEEDKGIIMSLDLNWTAEDLLYINIRDGRIGLGLSNTLDRRTSLAALRYRSGILREVELQSTSPSEISQPKFVNWVEASVVAFRRLQDIYTAKLEESKLVDWEKLNVPEGEREDARTRYVQRAMQLAGSDAKPHFDEVFEEHGIDLDPNPILELASTLMDDVLGVLPANDQWPASEIFALTGLRYEIATSIVELASSLNLKDLESLKKQVVSERQKLLLDTLTRIALFADDRDAGDYLRKLKIRKVSKFFSYEEVEYGNVNDFVRNRLEGFEHVKQSGSGRDQFSINIQGDIFEVNVTPDSLSVICTPRGKERWAMSAPTIIDMPQILNVYQDIDADFRTVKENLGVSFQRLP